MIVTAPSNRMTLANQVILQTNRCNLRHFTLNDTAFIVRLLNSPGWLKFIGDRNVRTEEDATYYLLNGPLKSYRENGFGLYMVELKNYQTPIGMCGLLKREYLEHPDIGFAFLPEYTGAGYAFEAAQGILKHATENLDLQHLMAITLPHNHASIRLLEKLGMKFLRNITAPSNEELMLMGN